MTCHATVNTVCVFVKQKVTCHSTCNNSHHKKYVVGHEYKHQKERKGYLNSIQQGA
jgi:hypothetical protein